MRLELVKQVARGVLKKKSFVLSKQHTNEEKAWQPSFPLTMGFRVGCQSQGRFDSGCTEQHPFAGPTCMSRGEFDPCDCTANDGFEPAQVACMVVEPGTWNVQCPGDFECPGNFRCNASFSCPAGFTDDGCSGYFTMNYGGACVMGLTKFQCKRFTCSSYGAPFACVPSFGCGEGDYTHYSCHRGYGCTSHTGAFDCGAMTFGCSDYYDCVMPFNCPEIVMCGSPEEKDDDFFGCVVDFTPGKDQCELEERFSCTGDFKFE